MTRSGCGPPTSEYGGNVQGIAALIFTRYVFAFEATSALLITAAVGAMVLAHRERLVKKRTQADLAGDRMRRYAETGQHPGPLPTPGVFARHNAVDTPALLPDGTASELSVSATLRARGTIREQCRPGQADRRDRQGHRSGFRGRKVSAAVIGPELVEGPHRGLRQAQPAFGGSRA